MEFLHDAVLSLRRIHLSAHDSDNQRYQDQGYRSITTDDVRKIESILIARYSQPTHMYTPTHDASIVLNDPG